MTTMPAIFSDKRGSEQIDFHTTGTWLSTRIRGVDFEGREFASLTPAVPSDHFDLHHGDLFDCSFHVDMPIRLRTPEGIRRAQIEADIKLGYQADGHGGHNSESIRITMIDPAFSIIPIVNTDFEYGLLSLNTQLLEGFALEACITCGLSDYSPAGNSTFGSLACFRDVAELYRKVDSKSDMFALWDRLTGCVQETHYCPCYEKRPPGRGYRG